MSSGTFNLALVLSATNRTGAVFNAVQSRIGTLENQQRRFTQAQNNLLNVGTGLAVAGAGYAVKQAMDLERTKITFKVFLGDMEKSKQLLKDLNDFADFSPFDNREVYDAAKALLPFFDNAKEIIPLMSKIGDVATGVQIPMQELALTMAKIKARDIVQAPELEILQTAGITTKDIAKSMGVHVNQIMDLSKNRKINYKAIEKTLTDMTSEGGRFHGLMAEIAATSSGLLSTAVGKANYSLTELTERLLPMITASLERIIPLIEAFHEFAQTNPVIAEGLVNVLAGITALSVGGKVINFIYQGMALNVIKVLEWARYIRNVRAAYIALSAAQAAGNMSAWYTALQNYGSAGNLASRALGLATASQLGFNASILTNPYVLGAAAIIALGTALYFANENMTELTETQQMQLEATGEVAKSMAKEHSEFTKLWDAMTKVNPKSKEGLELKKQLNTQFPQYLKNIDLEKAKLEDLPNLYSKASEAAFMYHAAKNLSSKMEKTLDEKSEIYLDNICPK